jgi:hypothetical protein
MLKKYYTAVLWGCGSDLRMVPNMDARAGVVSAGDLPTVAGSGYPVDNQRAGWDWRLFPGTTAMLRNPQDLFVPLDRNYYIRNYYDGAWFSGSTTLERDGIWGDLHKTQRYWVNGDIHPIAINMQFKKSAFCSDNRITVITTDIGQNTPDSDNPAIDTNFVTTLYQNSFAADPAMETCWVDGAEVSAFPTETTLPTGTAHTLVDNEGNGYFIPASQPPLRIARRERAWTFALGSHPKNGASVPLLRTGVTGTPGFAFKRILSATDFVYVVEATTNLLVPNWAGKATNLAGAAGHAGQGIAEVLRDAYTVRGLDIRTTTKCDEMIEGSVLDPEVCRRAV